MLYNNMSERYDFSDIAPIDDSDFSAKMSRLVLEPGFEHAVRFAIPDVDYPEFANRLRSVKDKTEFQVQIMVPFLKMLEAKTSDGITCDGVENIDPGKVYTYLSNHRDIVLDASFLNLCLLTNGLRTSEVAIGSNLLIFDWITDLVKLNKSFIVKRNIQRTKALEAAHQLSAYIHYAISEKHESVWIAQREGRAKDSNDFTQESLLKMLALEGDGGFIGNLLDINVLPVSISYEYDPNDYLKAREFLLKRLDPEFKKSQHDDLLSMETGLLKYKGRIHFHFSGCINDELRRIDTSLPKVEIVKSACHIIDRAIHTGYHIYPINYVAYDKLHGGGNRFASMYTPQQAHDVEEYIESQLAKVVLPDASKLDRDYMREMMYAMYANPLRNKLEAERQA